MPVKLLCCCGGLLPLQKLARDNSLHSCEADLGCKPLVVGILPVWNVYCEVLWFLSASTRWAQKCQLACFEEPCSVASDGWKAHTLFVMLQCRASVSPLHVATSLSQVSKPGSALLPHVSSPCMLRHLFFVFAPHPYAYSNLQPLTFCSPRWICFACWVCD